MSSLHATAPSSPVWGRGRRLLRPALLWAGVCGLAVLLAVRDPQQPGHYPSCPFYAMTGLYCPGCGATRCLADLVHGDLPGAFGYHPVLPLLVVWSLWLLARHTGDVVAGRTRPVRVAPFVPALVGASVVLFTVARNLPGWDWLSPA